LEDSVSYTADIGAYDDSMVYKVTGKEKFDVKYVKKKDSWWSTDSMRIKEFVY